MAYQPYDRTAKGIVFFGENASDQVYESTSGFVYTSGTSTLDVPNVGVSGNLDVGGNGTFDGDLTVYGNLNVSGVVNQINLQELLVEDNSIILNSNYNTNDTEPTADASIVVNRGPDGSTVKDVDIRWDEGNNYWSFTNDGNNYHALVIEGSGLSHRFPASNAGHPILDFDIDDLPIVTSAQDGDYIAIADSSDGNATRKITRSNLLTGLGAGTVTSIDVNGGSGITVPESGPITSNGTFTVNVNVDNSTLEVHTDDNLRIKDSGISFNHLSDTLVIASGEAFSDVDNALMTAAAIADKIESYGYSTTTGTITQVIGGSGLLPDDPGATSGSITLHVNPDNNTIGVNGSDEVYVRDLGIDTAQLAAGAITEAKRERTVGTYNSTSSITHDIALGAGVITLTLPTPASGQMVFVKRVDANSGALTISGGGANIDGASNKALYYQYESINVVSDGTNWFIV